jgi:hypothetical protein
LLFIFLFMLETRSTQKIEVIQDQFNVRVDVSMGRL